MNWSPRLGAHLETARVQAGLRRLDLANRLGVSEESIRLWERGAVQPSEAHLVRLIPMLSVEAATWTAASAQDPDDDLPDLARWLRQEREQRGQTQAAMAADLGVPQATYAGWETGRSTPSPQHHGLIAALLGIAEAEVEAQVQVPFQVDYHAWPAFGRLMGEHRQQLRLTRADLAARLGVSPRSIKSWELGHRRPAPAQLTNLAAAIGVPVERLAGHLPKRLPPTRLGELIAERQAVLGLRAGDIARLVGTTEPTLSRWVNGRSRPGTDNARRLAQALQVPPSRVTAVLGAPS